MAFGEEELKKLFAEYSVEVGIIRMKSDGHKVFSFAEAPNMDEVEKAIKSMDGKEIEGRRLRVRGSKDTDKKRKDGSKGSDDKKASKRRKVTKIPTVVNSKRHLVTAFVAFIDRELAREETANKEDFKGLLEASKTALSAAFELPEDDSLKVEREIEEIFFRAARLDIKFPEEPEPEVKEGGEEVKEGEEAAKDGSAKEGEAEAKESEDKAKEEKVDAVMEESVADSEAKVNGEKEKVSEDDSKVAAEVAEGSVEAAEAAAPMDTEDSADKPDTVDEDAAVLEAVNDENLMEDLENALAGAVELLDAPDEEEVAEKEDESVKEVTKTPGRGRGRGRRGKRA